MGSVSVGGGLALVYVAVPGLQMMGLGRCYKPQESLYSLGGSLERQSNTKFCTLTQCRVYVQIATVGLNYDLVCDRKS